MCWGLGGVERSEGMGDSTVAVDWVTACKARCQAFQLVLKTLGTYTGCGLGFPIHKKSGSSFSVPAHALLAFVVCDQSRLVA